MTSKAIVLRRLVSQGLVPGSGPSAAAGARFSSAEAVVRWMGCVQAQDFAMGKWGVGLRFSGATDAAVETDFDAGSASLGTAAVLLLPAWDEYTVAYKDRSHFLHADHVSISSYGLKPVVVVNGKVVGVWRRVLERERVIVEVSPFAAFSKAVVRAVGVAAKGYGRFLGRGVEVVYG